MRGADKMSILQILSLNAAWSYPKVFLGDAKEADNDLIDIK